ncbi:serine hydrolase domain-containing protein [Clostridium sardiniense]|uniref:serine hydrolase domain-containing protein n=1 Tax=Clostridium sardiniense TaxID=29369 RepID=UPI003D33F138
MREDISNNIRKKISEIKDFSGVVSIRCKDKDVYNEAFGFADLNNERKNNKDTRFGIASGAKIFTSISICKLIEEGKLSFESLLIDILGYEFNNFNKEVKIKHLLTHTSGIPDYFDEEVMSDFSELWIENPMYLLREPKDFIPLLKKGRTMFKPGDKFHYNNGAFIVLGLVVEKVSGKSFVDFVQENIFDIANMKDSGYFAMDNLPKNSAYGYLENKEGKLITNIYSIPVVGGPDGGIFVTSRDMNKLWNSLFNYKLLSKKMTDNLLKPQVDVNKDVYYGYGIWIIKNEDEIFKYYLTGSDPGVDFISAIYPKSNLEVTILCNREFGAYEISSFIESMDIQ